MAKRSAFTVWFLMAGLVTAVTTIRLAAQPVSATVLKAGSCRGVLPMISKPGDAYYIWIKSGETGVETWTATGPMVAAASLPAEPAAAAWRMATRSFTPVGDGGIIVPFTARRGPDTRVVNQSQHTVSTVRTHGELVCLP